MTRQPVFGRDSLATGAVPDRSPGPLGWQDAADPDEPLCMAGDTPGPVGTGFDQSSHMSSMSSAPALEVPVLEVSIEKVERFFYTVGLAEAQDFYAKRGFGSANVELGRPAEVENRARLTASRLMNEFRGVLPGGPQAVHAFLDSNEKAKSRSTESLRKKFSDASQAGSNQVQALGAVIKFLAAVRFTSTVAVKVMGLHPAAGGLGTVVDIANDVALDGVDAAFSKDKKVGAVVVTSAKESAEDWLKEVTNEAVANKFISRSEEALMKDLFKNFRGDQAELLKQIERVEKRLIAAAQGSKSARQAAKKYVSKLERLGRLRRKAFKAAMKGTAGKAFTLVFLADDIKDAWGTMSDTWQASN